AAPDGAAALFAGPWGPGTAWQPARTASTAPDSNFTPGPPSECQLRIPKLLFVLSGFNDGIFCRDQCLPCASGWFPVPGPPGLPAPTSRTASPTAKRPPR